jgi:hypothetical protein
MLEKIESSVGGYPCVVYKLNGGHHKTNGPAMTVSGDQTGWGWEAWYLDGHKHRYYGDSNPVGDWFIHGTRIK